jgi:hypothetical protein
LTRLTDLDLSDNQLAALPKSLGLLTSLTYLDLSGNYLTKLPYTLRKIGYLRVFNIGDNPLDLDPIMLRWVKRVKIVKKKTFYEDGQNIHHSEITQSTKKSIDCLLNLKIYDKDVLTKILADPDLSPRDKEFLYKNSQDECVHSGLGVTFLDALSLVYPLLCSSPEPREAKKILTEEIREAEDKCLTGKIVRLVNSLNGLHPAVQIRFSDQTEIENIFNFLMKKHVYLSPEELKIFITNELIERGYSKAQIVVWTDSLDEIE